MNFKKCTSILMAFYLLVSTSGFAFNVHYCEGEIASISSVFKLEETCEPAVQHEEKTCCAIVTDDHSSCCSDQLFQADFDESILKTVVLDFHVSGLLPTYQLPVFVNFSTKISTQAVRYYVEDHATPLYQLYSQYVFYA